MQRKSRSDLSRELLVFLVHPKTAKFQLSCNLTINLPEYEITDLGHPVYKFHKTEENRVTLAKLNNTIKR